MQPDGAGTVAWKRNDSGVAGICQLCVGDGDAAHGVKISAAARRADGNEEAEEVERREIFLGLLE